jgi:hypothetical protein
MQSFCHAWRAPSQNRAASAQKCQLAKAPDERIIPGVLSNIIPSYSGVIGLSMNPAVGARSRRCGLVKGIGNPIDLFRRAAAKYAQEFDAGLLPCQFCDAGTYEKAA